MVVRCGGLVGIGTTSPQAVLEAYSSTGTGTAVYGYNVGGTSVYGQNTSGTGVYGYATSGTAVFGQGTNATGGAFQSAGSGIYAAYAQNSNSGGLAFLGQDTSNGYFCQLGLPGYSIACSGPTSGVSDQRLKKDIHPLNPGEGLDAVMKLQPVHYRWKDERMNTDHPAGEIGFIAQNVETVLPQLVGEVAQVATPRPPNQANQPKDDTPKLPGGKQKTLQYERLIAPVVLAVQQLKSLLDSDHDVVAKLKADNDNEAKEIKELRSEIEQLKAAHH